MSRSRLMVDTVCRQFDKQYAMIYVVKYKVLTHVYCFYCFMGSFPIQNKLN